MTTTPDVTLIDDHGASALYETDHVGTPGNNPNEHTNPDPGVNCIIESANGTTHPGRIWITPNGEIRYEPQEYPPEV